ncbi:hypothetical protein [Variibacter gotjawalensis]|uniref:hypothetical protein n=1 Tax=Variibacter gotjawalensis TaxID=1333996 RepID=UPI00141B8547|nr:hypothetical protein [Variibacter gotjawalensis]NIK49259.1 hypothetical protein [Variibacter gotjawalensis]
MDRGSEIGGGFDKFRITAVRRIAMTAKINPLRFGAEFAPQQRRQWCPVVPAEIQRGFVPNKIAVGDGEQHRVDTLVFEPPRHLHAAPFRRCELRREQQYDGARAV